MVKSRLSAEDAQTYGWLLDGYPRSASQAEAIEAVNIRPDIFILINVRLDSVIQLPTVLPISQSTMYLSLALVASCRRQVLVASRDAPHGSTASVDGGRVMDAARLTCARVLGPNAGLTLAAGAG